MEKICIKCKIPKFIEEFSKKSKSKDGYSNTCKECHSTYRKEHYKKNKDKIFEQVNKYKKDNPEKYNNKFANRKPNKKAGRIIDTKCSNPNCNITIFVTLKDSKNHENRYCSRECRNYKFEKIKTYFNLVKRNAKKRNIIFDLDFEYVKELFKNKCAITNAEIRFDYGKTTLYSTPSLDRKDSNKGYIKGNVQWVMLGINYMKLNYSDEELHKTLKIIVENYEGVV